MTDSRIANRLLAALPSDEYERMLPQLEQFPLKYGDNIYATGSLIKHVYFPASGIISLLSAVDERSLLEIGIVGKEGMVGLGLYLGVKRSANRADRSGFGPRRSAKVGSI